MALQYLIAVNLILLILLTVAAILIFLRMDTRPAYVERITIYIDGNRGKDTAKHGWKSTGPYATLKYAIEQVKKFLDTPGQQDRRLRELTFHISGTVVIDKTYDLSLIHADQIKFFSPLCPVQELPFEGIAQDSLGLVRLKMTQDNANRLHNCWMGHRNNSGRNPAPAYIDETPTVPSTQDEQLVIVTDPLFAPNADNHISLEDTTGTVHIAAPLATDTNFLYIYLHTGDTQTLEWTGLDITFGPDTALWIDHTTGDRMKGELLMTNCRICPRHSGLMFPGRTILSQCFISLDTSLPPPLIGRPTIELMTSHGAELSLRGCIIQNISITGLMGSSIRIYNTIIDVSHFKQGTSNITEYAQPAIRVQGGDSKVHGGGLYLIGNYHTKPLVDVRKGALVELDRTYVTMRNDVPFPTDDETTESKSEEEQQIDNLATFLVKVGESRLRIDDLFVGNNIHTLTSVKVQSSCALSSTLAFGRGFGMNVNGDLRYLANVKANSKVWFGQSTWWSGKYYEHAVTGPNGSQKLFRIDSDTTRPDLSGVISPGNTWKYADPTSTGSGVNSTVGGFQHVEMPGGDNGRLANSQALNNIKEGYDYNIY